MKTRRYTSILIFVIYIVSFIGLQAQYLSQWEDPLTRAISTSLPVGTLPGKVDVNSKGAATYEIPISIAPGTAGFQPGLSIIYNSNFKEGLLGLGWDLSGLSTIYRVPQNYYNDNKKVGVQLQYSDGFALDSNRLVLQSGTYGYPGSIYKTEFETFSRITAYGNSGNGPSYFIAQTKDGKTIEYGNTASSKVEAPGSQTVYMWRINKIIDANGNYIYFKYNELNGESFIDSIKYTGNLNTNLQPYNCLKFFYGAKYDENSKYVGGSKIANNFLLTGIKVTSEGVLVRRYQFNYFILPTYLGLDLYTHLNKIDIYADDDSTQLNPTIIGWGNGLGQVQISQNDITGLNQQSIYYPGDFNGDGVSDLLITPRKTSYTSSDKWKLYLGINVAPGYFMSKSEGFLNSTFKSFQIIDADGNGRDEIYWRARETVFYSCNPHLCDGGIESIVQSTETSEQATGITIESIIPPPPQDTCWDVCSYPQEAFRIYRFNDTTLIRGNISYDHVFANGDPNLTMNLGDFDGDGDNDFMFLLPNKKYILYKRSLLFRQLSKF